MDVSHWPQFNSRLVAEETTEGVYVVGIIKGMQGRHVYGFL